MKKKMLSNSSIKRFRCLIILITVTCGISGRASCPPPATSWGRMRHIKFGFWIALTMRKCSWKADELIMSQRYSRGGSVMGWCHSCVSSLPQPILLSIPGDTTWSFFLFPIVLHSVLTNSCPAKPKLLWQGDGLVGGWRAIHRYCPMCAFHFIVSSWYLFHMGILYLFFFACLVLRYP